MKRLLLAASLLGALGAAAGCGAQDVLLGAQRGYLFSGYDVLALPDEEVSLQARLQAGDLLRARPGHVIRFLQDGQLYRAAETDTEGVATVAFTAAKPGDYLFTAEVSPVGLPDTPPDPIEILVACRGAADPMIAVDMDKTLVASGFHMVLVGAPEPMPKSPEVMKRLAGQFSIIYLTHRPEYFGPKSKRWLREQGYPRGPVLLSTVGGFLKGSREYKTEMLRALGQRFKAIRVGIGDKIGDAQAYHDNGLRAFLIIQVGEDAGAGELRDLADQLEALPDEVQVVTGWDQVEQGIFAGATYPRSAAQQHLRTLADQREPPAEKQQ